jgi:sortase B
MAVTEREPNQQTQAPVRPDRTSELEPPMTVDFASLKAINDDVIGWIFIEALDDVNYPVVRGIDNNFYLHQTYQKNYNFAGTIFADYENSDDFNDCNTIIYGHNMKNGSMFGQLRKFSSSMDAYNESKYFWIFTPDKDYRYEIISAYTTAVNSDTYTLFKGPGQEFQDYLNKIVTYSEIVTTPGNLNVNDKIVTLSTCTGDDSTRYVVQGKRVDTIEH